MFTTHSIQKAGLFLLKNAFQRVVLSFLYLLLPLFLFSQEKTVEKANLAYTYKQFAQAAALYETAISEKEANGKSPSATLSLKTKLAYCYRMNNKMDQAEKLYAEIVQDERAKSETYLYYGETLMSNGKYEEAKKWFLDYQTLEPDDEQAALMVANCDKIQFIEPYFPYVEIKEFAFNSEADDNAPVSWQNGIVFSSDRKQKIKLMKEKSGWTGRDYLDLYFSVLKEDSSYGEPRRFSSKLSEVNKNTGNASFSSDGTEVFFTRNDNVLNKKETYNLQLFRSVNNGGEKWKKAEKLSFCSPNYSFMHPAISPDGKQLFFASNRKGEGGVDLWVSSRKGDIWGRPENLGPTINTSANEGFPFMDENGRLYFCSKGHSGYGGFDIFFTELDEKGEWKTPQNLGQPINSPLDDISIYINGSGKSGMFTSSRNGGDDDIYFFEVLEKAPVGEPFVGIVPVSSNNTEPFINKKPTAIPPVETIEEKTIEIAETPELEHDPFVPSVPQNYQPASSKNEEVLVAEESVIEEKIAEDSMETPDPFADLSVLEEEEEVLEEQGTTSQSDAIFFEIPKEQPEITDDSAAITSPTANALFTFQEFMERAVNIDLQPGQIYRLDGATFDPNIWQLTPKIARPLNDLVTIMRRFPSLRIELSAHTETLGLESENLKISKNRVDMAIEYLTKEGISPDRLEGIGYGESMPLNHCLDGVTCSEEEHLYNQRFEIRVLQGVIK